MNAKWTRRVALAVAALDEKAISELEQLRDEIEDMLPGGRPFDPAQAIADPAPLSQRAEQTVRFYRARTRMEGDMIWLRRLGRILLAGLIGLEAAAAGLTAHFAQLVNWGLLRIAGFILLGLAVLTLVLTAATYVLLQDRLAGAEILAGTGGRADHE